MLSDGTTLSTRGRALQLEGDAESVDDVLGSSSVLKMRAGFAGGIAIDMTITAYDGQPGVVLSCELPNDNAEPVRVARFEVLQGASVDLGSVPSTWRIYKHGWQSWSPTLALDCAGEDVPITAPVIAPGRQPEAREGRIVSDMMTAIVSPQSGQGIVAGFITTGEQMAQLWIDCESGALSASSYADGITVPPGGRLASERLLIEPTNSPLEAMERYGDALGRSMGARVSSEVACGWCSWYQYWQGVTEGLCSRIWKSFVGGKSYLSSTCRSMMGGRPKSVTDWRSTRSFPTG